MTPAAPVVRAFETTEEHVSVGEPLFLLTVAGMNFLSEGRPIPSGVDPEGNEFDRDDRESQRGESSPGDPKNRPPKRSKSVLQRSSERGIVSRRTSEEAGWQEDCPGGDGHETHQSGNDSAQRGDLHFAQADTDV